jgi:hypothetical protein
VKPEDFARHGSVLLERVREQVDAPQGLDRLRRNERSNRIVAVAFAVALVAAFALVGGLWWLNTDIPPADQPTTTTLRTLPVEISIVLLDQFTIDAQTGACSGEGDLIGFTANASVGLVETAGAGTLAETAGEGTVIATVELPAGNVITAADVVVLGGSTRSADACRFTLPDTGLAIGDFQSPDVDIVVALDSPRPSITATSGQRHTYFYGGDR